MLKYSPAIQAFASSIQHLEVNNQIDVNSQIEENNQIEVSSQIEENNQIEVNSQIEENNQIDVHNQVVVNNEIEIEVNNQILERYPDDFKDIFKLY